VAAANLIDIKDCSIIFADDEAGLTSTTPAPADFKCQVNSAAINAVPKLQTVPATFCAAETQVPAATGWQLVLTFLQDWGATNSLSQYLFDNDATQKWFQMTPNDVTLDSVPGAKGQCWVVAGAYLGAAGAPVNAASTMPIAAKPTIAGVGLLMASEATNGATNGATSDVPADEAPADDSAFATA
jgi:hypothetical protein